MNCLFLLYISTVKLSGKQFYKIYCMPKLLIAISVFCIFSNNILKFYSSVF